MKKRGSLFRNKKSFWLPRGLFSHSILLVLGFACGYYYCQQSHEPAVIQTANNVTIQPCFTPQYKCQPLILKEIAQAQRSIHMMAYSFTAKPIAKALVAAHRRGVQVQVMLDRSQLNNRSVVHIFRSANIPVLVDDTVAIAHNKVLILDGNRLIVGPYNFTNAAEYKNAENLLVIHNPEIAQAYLKNWKLQYQEALPIIKNGRY